jgi:hypothetical protein
MLNHLSSNAKCVNKLSMRTTRSLGCLIHYLSLSNHGKISLWILLMACQRVRVFSDISGGG